MTANHPPTRALIFALQHAGYSRRSIAVYTPVVAGQLQPPEIHIYSDLADQIKKLEAVKLSMLISTTEVIDRKTDRTVNIFYRPALDSQPMFEKVYLPVIEASNDQ